MKFRNWKQMYDYIIAGNDLYNVKTGDFVYVYNDADALCLHFLDEHQVKDVIREASYDKDCLGAFLTGGEVLDDSKYDEFRYSEEEAMRALYLAPSYDYCKEAYDMDGWINIKEYAEMVQEKELEK